MISFIISVLWFAYGRPPYVVSMLLGGSIGEAARWACAGAYLGRTEKRTKGTQCNALRVLLVVAMIVAAMAPITAAFGGDEKTDVYVVVMNDDPVISYEGGIPGLEATKPVEDEKVNTEDKKVKDYGDYLEDEQDEALADAGLAPDATIQSYKFAPSGFSAVLTESQAAELQRNSKVAVVRLDELQPVDTENSGTFLGLKTA